LQTDAAQKYAIFPVLNAVLNGVSAVLLLIGHSFIKRGKIGAHRASMISAFFSSTVFLSSYLYYHAHVGVIRFRGVGWIRPVYFTILTSHTILAASLLVLVPTTLILALRSSFPRHRAIARWTYPIWLYVSVTGVVIYFMVYRWFVG
jgi:putative membrane protein